MRIVTDPEIVFDQNSGIPVSFVRSKAYYVGSAEYITVSIHTGSGTAVGQKLRAYGSIKTLGNRGTDPVDINEDVTPDNAFAPLLMCNLTDGCCVNGKDGLTLSPDSNGLFEVTIRGISYVYFEIEGSGVPVTLLIRTYNK